MTRLFLLKNLKRHPEGDFYWQLNVHAISKNYPVIAAAPTLSQETRCPTHFIRGSLSAYIKDDDISGCLRWFPNATMQTIEGASHWVHSDKPAEFIELCLSALL